MSAILKIRKANVLEAEAVLSILALSFLFFVVSENVVLALPSGYTVESGDVSVDNSQSNKLTITASDHAIINFDSFSINQNETIQFIQPSSSSSLLSRVTGSSATDIYGTLIANGQLVIVNQNGITFHETANIQVQSLIASTLEIQNAMYLQNQLTFEKALNSNPGQILNEADITVADQGHVALLSEKVKNTGTLTAKLGSVVLASGEKTTISFDNKGLINLVIDKGLTSAIPNAVDNQGTIKANGGRAVMNAETLNDALDTLVNNTGVVEAMNVVEKNGQILMLSGGGMKVMGELAAASGEVIMEAASDIIIGPLTTVGNATVKADNSIKVEGDVTTDSGNLTLKADADKDGQGTFLQEAGTAVKTTTYGDIAIESSGQSTLATIVSAGNLTLSQAGAPVIYTQYAGSSITTQGSLNIKEGATFVIASEAKQSEIASSPSAPRNDVNVGKDWVNHGAFVAGNSTVTLTGPKDATVFGDNTFNNFTVIEPSKNVSFESGKTQEITGILTLQGGFGKLMALRSTSASIPWKISATGTATISYVLVQNSENVHIHGPPLKGAHLQNSLGNTGWDFFQAGPVWTNSNNTLIWSDPLNWDGGFIPGPGDYVILRSISDKGSHSGDSSPPQNMVDQNDSIIDPLFSGTIKGLTLESSYTGTLTLQRDLTVKSDVTLAGGTLDLGSQNLTLGGSWNHPGGLLNAPMQILTPTGWRNLSEIQIGDEVIAYDSDGNQIINTVEAQQVLLDTGDVEAPFTFYLINGKYKLFKDQSIRVNNGVVHAFEIQMGDTIFNDNNQSVNVTSIEELTTETQWTQFNISGNHSYIVDGLLLHNASRYWVGGGASANWDATGNTNWSATSGGANNASVPGSTDDVFFDGVGGGASNSTLSAAITIRSLNMTGYANTLTHNASVALSIGDGTAGASNVALTMVAGMTYTLGSVTTSSISFISTSTTVQTVDFASKTTGNVTYNGVAGSWQMTGTHNTGATATVTLTNGTLNTNGQTMSVGLFNSTNSNTRVLTLGASAITIAGTGTPWTLATATGLTFTANTAAITLSGASVTFAGGAKTYGGTVSLTGSGTPIITGVNSFANLTRTGTAVKTDVFQLNANQTVTGTLTLSGNSAINRVLVQSDTIGTARTITNSGATMTWSNVDFKDITLGTAFDASAITGNSGNAGGNSGITFTTAANQYMKVGASANWSASNWFTTSGGSTAGRVPLPQDTAIFDALSITAASVTITQDMPRIGGVDFTGVTNTPTFTTSTAASVFGSMTLISGMTLTASTQAYTFEGRGSFILTNGGLTWAKSITVNAPGGTLSLGDNFNAGTGNTLTLTNGTFDANGKNVTTGLFNSGNTNTRVVTMGSGTWTITGNAGLVWNASNLSGLTLNRGNPVLLNYSGSTGSRGVTWGDVGGGTETNAPDISVTAGSDNIYVNGSNGGPFRHLDFTGFTGSLAAFGTTIYGNLTLASGMTLTAGTNIWTFSATSGTQTITSNGKTIDNVVTFNGVGGTFQLADALTVGATRTVTLTNGTLNANNKDFSMGKFASSNSNTRTLTMGSGTWTLASTGTVWTTATTTGLTLTSTTATIKTTDSSATDKTISAGSLAGFPSIWISAGTATTTFTNVTNVNNLDFTGFTGTGPVFPATINGNLTLVSGMTMPAASATAITFAATSGTKTITSAGQTIDRPLTFDGVGGTWQLADAMTVGSTRAFNITNGTLDLASFNLSASGAFTLGAGGTLKLQGGETVSTIDTVTAGSTVIYNGTGSYTTALAAGNTYSNLTFNGVGGIWEPNGAVSVGSNLTITNGTFDIDGQNLTVTSTFSNAGTLRLTGGETTVSLTNDTDSGTVEYDGTASYTGLKAGNTYNDLIFNGTGGTWTLSAALDVNDDLTLTAGTLDVSTTVYGITVGGDWTDSGAGAFTERTGTVTFDGTGTLNSNEAFNDVTINSSGTVTLGANLDVDDDLTLTAGTLNVSTTNYNIALGGDWSNSGTFTAQSGTVTLDGADQTISGTTSFYNLTKTVTTARMLTFKASSTQTITNTLQLEGAASNLLSLRSGTTGTQWNVDPQGTRTIQYLDVKDSKNTNGTAINTAGFNVTNSGNNTGWTFSNPASSGGGFTSTQLNDFATQTHNAMFMPQPIFISIGDMGFIAPIAAPMPVQAPGSSVLPKPFDLSTFQGLNGSVVLPQPVSFEGVQLTNIIPSPFDQNVFQGINSNAVLPQPVSFEGVFAADSKLSPLEVQPTAIVPPQRKYEDLFVGVSMTTMFTVKGGQKPFDEIQVKIIMPIDIYKNEEEVKTKGSERLPDNQANRIRETKASASQSKSSP